ncbi:hypothetical protein B0A48_02779 [Cryoendolithus antarcticus]|uniref:Uncharacterized protein n=1 Tax=Cryoendolithus antarcticus TaxID=1507870 RepID=A0A1V8TL87_9PEZI|nr:hypothetical protein B0A48_02779 [Cryoendolithus antarcticus]
MQKIYFVFGPEGSFFFAGAKGSERQVQPDAAQIIATDHLDSAGLPAGVETRTTTAASVSNIAVSDRGSSNNPIAYIAFVKKADPDVWRWCSKSFQQAMGEKMSDFDEIGKGLVRFAFGERGHLLVWTVQGKWLWQKPGNMLPSSLYDNSKAEIECASLGVGDSYLIIAKNGQCWWDTKSHYPALQAILDDVQPGDIIFAALNPFRVGQFFILFANDTAVFQVPLSYRTKLESALKKHGITCTALTSQQAEKKVKMPNAAKQPDFAKRLLKDVTGPVIGAVVSGIASALIGAVACTVM